MLNLAADVFYCDAHACADAAAVVVTGRFVFFCLLRSGFCADLYTFTTITRYLVVVWDAWFCEGSKVIFRYGLALLKMYKKRLKALSKSCRCVDKGESYKTPNAFQSCACSRMTAPIYIVVSCTRRRFEHHFLWCARAWSAAKVC